MIKYWMAQDTGLYASKKAFSEPWVVRSNQPNRVYPIWLLIKEQQISDEWYGTWKKLENLLRYPTDVVTLFPVLQSSV